MGFGGFMIGLVGYGFGLFALLCSVLAARDIGVAKKNGASSDGMTENQNAKAFVQWIIGAFASFVVTWLILKI